MCLVFSITQAYFLGILTDLLVPFDSNLELYKEFAEEAFSIALHPSGLYICVGFSDKLRLMNLLIDDIRTFKEFPIRGCKEVCYIIFLCIVCLLNNRSVSKLQTPVTT